MPQPVFKHIGIIGKYRLHDVEDTIRRVMALLDTREIAYSLDQHTMPESLLSHPSTAPISAWSDEVDLCVVIGGDGTFLYAGRNLLDHQIPLVGINAGHLGFLADIPSATLEDELTAILGGDYCSEIRHTLHVVVENEGVRQATFYAVNDAVIHKRNMARMIDLEVYTRERFLAHYRADGLIIATPTGSTAYALSAGGPIVEPSLSATLLVPICPHTLMQRPVVLDARRTVRACLNRERFKDVQLTIDGQEEYIMQAGDSVVVRQAQTLNVIHPARYKFQQRLREKFHWGVAGEISSDRGGSDA